MARSTTSGSINMYVIAGFVAGRGDHRNWHYLHWDVPVFEAWRERWAM